MRTSPLRLTARSRRFFVATTQKQRASASSPFPPSILPPRLPPLSSTAASSLADMTSGGDLSVDESRAKLKQQFSNFSGERYVDGWADLWEKGDFLPWDRMQPSPALADTLVNGRHLVGSPFVEEGGQRRRKRALIPGCGRGVDVLLLQSFGYDAVGLEVSPKAVDACRVFAREKETEYPVRDEEAGKGSCSFVLGDFYKNDWIGKAGLFKDTRFELIYDYTFFCAMNPVMRPAWAKRMSDLLAPNQFSQLICLEFPGLKSPQAGGPPFSSPPKAYMEHLSHPGQNVAYSEEGEVRVNPLAEISPGGLERIAHFHPTDTHKIGKDAEGNVTDHVSIWRHRY